ncbi:hypothetical protein ABWL39_12055 [Chitinivorax sp. PXF-14]|uniref:hypothetical protein n=1 Tax=Chitinivorax sp. PXF-14 TaxID=3230488 RepID=UPI003466BA3D
MRRVAARLLLCFTCCPGVLAAATLHAGPDDYLSRLAELQPGDELLLAPGVYRGGLPVHRLLGTAEQPIIIAGDPDKRAVFLARANRNTVSIVDSAYVTVRNLVLDGGDQPADGVRAEGNAQWAHHITLEHLLIVRHGVDQGYVGISTKCPAWNWVIRDNRIVGAGTGMYLGNSDGRAPFVVGLIERNVVADSIGYNLQIKHQQPRPPLPDMPVQPSRTLIRHNVFIKGHNSSSGIAARPSVLVGHWPLQGAGQDDLYEIYGNLFYQNPSEALFQGEGNIAFYHNVLFNSHGDAVHIQPHNDIPRRIDIFRNTVLATGDGILIRNPLFGAGEPQRVYANAVFSARGNSGGERWGNVEAEWQAAPQYLRAPFASAGASRLYPLPGRLRLDSADPAWLTAYTDAVRDFDGRRFASRYVGAYATASGQPLAPYLAGRLTPGDAP